MPPLWIFKYYIAAYVFIAGVVYFGFFARS